MRPSRLALAIALLLTVSGLPRARAQVLPLGASPSSTTSSTTSTTAPPAEKPAPPPASGDGAPPPEKADEFPPELAALSNSVRRTPANSTSALVAALEPLSKYGLDGTQRALIGFGRFPVAGEARWSDDWWLPRFGPGWRLHEGCDVFAAFGTPVRAPVGGTVRVTDGGLGGLAVYVTGADRTYWYLAHLSGLGPGIAEGVTVTTGQVVGYVGDSGNARGGPPHLHFEVHPGGGGPVPPKPVLDQFVRDALRIVVPSLLRAYATRPPVAPSLPSITPREVLLWASSMGSAGAGARLAELGVLDAARSIDWAARARAQADGAVSP